MADFALRTFHDFNHPFESFDMKFADSLSELISNWFSEIEYPSFPAALYEPIAYTLESGGKRLRPLLLLSALKAFRRDPAIARNQCIGIELFHNFTLLHDDVMDNSDVRRGQPTVHRKWNVNTAILSGDTMLTLATQYIAGCDERHLRNVLDTFNRTAIEVYEGQQLDMDFEQCSDVSVEEYLEMIRLKTSVLLGCALKIGAILADADEKETQALYSYGVNLGLGFQLRDDYLDTFGDPLVFGKHIGGDILNDKKTWLMINAALEDKTGTMLSVSGNRHNDEEKILKVTKVYRDLELDKRILRLIEDYSNKAIAELDNVRVSPESLKFFVELAEKMTNRNY